MDTFMDKLAQKFTAQELIKANSLAETEEMNRLKVQVEEYTGCLNRMKQICVDMEQAVESAKDKMDSAQLNTDELREQLLDIWQAMQNSASDPEADNLLRALLAEQLDEMKASQTAQIEALRSELDGRINAIQDIQSMQMESIQGFQAEQMESIRGLQSTQMESIRGLQDAQIEGIRGLQDAQFETMRNSMEDQLDSMRSMVKAQVSGLKNNQEGQLDGLRSAIDKQNDTIESQLNLIKEDLATQLSGSNEFVHRECVKVYRNVQAVVGEENSKQNDNLDYTLKPMSRRVINVQKISIAALTVSAISLVLQVLGIFGIV